jgi:hypothetical protein
MTPLIAWTVISKPPSFARGPVCPNADTEQYTSEGFAFASVP